MSTLKRGKMRRGFRFFSPFLHLHIHPVWSRCERRAIKKIPPKRRSIGRTRGNKDENTPSRCVAEKAFIKTSLNLWKKRGENFQRSRTPPKRMHAAESSDDFATSPRSFAFLSFLWVGFSLFSSTQPRELPMEK